MRVARLLLAIALAAACALLAARSAGWNPLKPPPAPAVALRAACRAAQVAYPPPRPRVLIRKGERTLSLYSGDTLVKRYPVALGRAPAGDKEREGDGRTPEGEFYVCTRLERSRFHRFLGISYPAPEDAHRGLEARLVTRAERDAILAAHRRRRKPSWDTRLGGAVGIHGGGTTFDWTLGCIALENDAVEELFAVLPHGTPVRIER